MQVCKRCVMDTTDSKIIFDSDGICDHCITYDTKIRPNWDTSLVGKKKIVKI